MQKYKDNDIRRIKDCKSMGNLITFNSLENLIYEI